MNPVLIVNERVPVANVEGSGVGYEAILTPKLYTAGNTNNAYECISDSTGWIYLRVDLLSSIVLTAQAQQLVYGWSYLANDGVAVKAAVNTQVARIGAGADGTITRNVGSTQLDPNKFPIDFYADPFNTIKTFYAVFSVSALATCFLSVSGTKPS